MTTTNLLQCMHWLSLMIIDEGINDQKDESLLAQMRPSMHMKQPKKIKLLSAMVAEIWLPQICSSACIDCHWWSHWWSTRWIILHAVQCMNFIACINDSCDEYGATKKNLNSYLLWFLRYEFQKFVPETTWRINKMNHLACSAVHEFYCLYK